MHQKRRVRRVQHVRPSSAASKSATPKRRPSAAVKRSRATASRRGRLGVWGATRRQRPAAQSAWAMAMGYGRGVTLLTLSIVWSPPPLRPHDPYSPYSPLPVLADDGAARRAVCGGYLRDKKEVDGLRAPSRARHGAEGRARGSVHRVALPTY